jgi:hypothetical protein
MRREFIKELRGDSRKEAFDLYNHIDMKELKEAYLACIHSWGYSYCCLSDSRGDINKRRLSS